MSRFNIRWMRGIGFVLGAVALTGVTASGVFAQGRPHPPADETAANNLSVPAIFVPGTTDSPFTGTCTVDDESQDPVPPQGVDTNGDGILDAHLDYYVQGVTTWQADCATAADNTLTVDAAWGDNLTNAPLKAGTPIRVEIGFLVPQENLAAFPMPGYVVEKLDPNLLDRESHYGTLGAKVDAFPEVRVWDSGVTLDIRSNDGTVLVANNIAFTAEINATGRVVYGFNWQNPVAGEYTITVKVPTIAIASTDAGALADSDSDGDFDTVTLPVTVGNKGGGGGGKGGRPGGGGPPSP